MRPNVLLIVLDTARADAFEPYGAQPGSSPAVADLARRGAAYGQVHAAASWTLPSHASMLTGLLPDAAGVLGAPERSPQAARPAVEANAERALPTVFRRAGYETRAVSTNLWVTRESGFGPGFDEFRFADSGRQAKLHRADLRSRASWDLEALRARVDDGAAVAGSLLRDWLGERREPFLWFVNLVECHSPYLPPAPWNDLGPRERLRAGAEARRHLTMGAIWRACAGAFDVPEPALERMRHLYARSVRLMDDWIADLLGELERAGVLEQTIVAVTSDHGENLGEGGLMGHAFSLDQRLLHVPLVLAGPGVAADPGVVSLAALPRLLADAAGIEAHPWADGLPADRVAVAQFEPPAPIGHPRWRQAFAEWGLEPGAAAERVARPLRAATDGRLKLQLRGEREQLYELERDPLELAPRTPTAADADAVAGLRSALAHPAASAGPGPPSSSAGEISDAERARLEDRMRLLGYM